MVEKVHHLRPLPLAALHRVAGWRTMCLTLVSLSATTSCERPAPYSHAQDRQTTLQKTRSMVDCTPGIDLGLLRDRSGEIADVRIFRLSKILLYIPTQWLGDLATTSDQSRFEAMVPILHSNECQGIVHELTDGASTSARYVDISIDVKAASDQIITDGSPTNISFWKMRKSERFREGFEPTLRFDRIIDSKDHRTEEAFIRALPEVGVRLNWRLPTITEKEWREKAGHWRAPLRAAGYQLKPNEIGAWGATVDTQEWRDMASGIRSLILWLSTPPATRDSNRKFYLVDSH